MYFWNDARPRLICVSAAERLSSSRSGELIRVIASSSKLSMCFSCPTMRSNGAPISRLADKIASAAMTSVSNPRAASRSFALRSIVARKSPAGMTVATTQSSKPNGAKVRK